MSKIGYVLITTFILFVSGCASAPSTFTNYSKTSKNFERIYMLNDVFVVEDVKGLLDRVNLHENRKFLEFVHTNMEETIRSKGYDVSLDSIKSVGFVATKEKPFLVVPGGQDVKPGWTPEAELSEGTSPFYYRQNGLVDIRAEDVERLHRRLYLSGGLKALSEKQIDFVRTMNFPESSAVLVTHSVGRRVPGFKKSGQMLLTGLLTLGTLMMWEPSRADHHIYLLDTETGAILWADKFHSSDTRIDVEDFQKSVKKLFKKLPDRPTAVGDIDGNPLPSSS